MYANFEPGHYERSFVGLDELLAHAPRGTVFESEETLCDHGPAEIYFRFYAFAKDVNGKAQPTIEAQILQWRLGYPWFVRRKSDVYLELGA